MMLPHGNWRSSVVLFGRRHVVHAAPLKINVVGSLGSTFQPLVALSGTSVPWMNTCA